MTWSVYKKLHEATLKARLRMRVWALQASTGVRMAWELRGRLHARSARRKNDEKTYVAQKACSENLRIDGGRL